MEELTDIEIQAEVFRIVRTNADLTKSNIMKKIHKHLPEISNIKIREALEALYFNGN